MSITTVNNTQSNSGMALLKFVNCHDQKMNQTRPWVEGQDPPWRVIRDGLNLRGQCPSVGNPCSKQTVWVPLSFSPSETTPFNLNRECAEARCIACKTLLTEVVNINLKNCRARFKGMDNDRNKVEEEKISPPENVSLTFEEQEGRNIVFWKYLDITVTRIALPEEKQCALLKWFCSFFKKTT